MNLTLKKLHENDPNYYLHRNGQQLACPFAPGGSVTQMVYPDNNLTIAGKEQSPISDNQPRRVTCGTWCALFRLYELGESNRFDNCVQGCSSVLMKENVSVER